MSPSSCYTVPPVGVGVVIFNEHIHRYLADANANRKHVSRRPAAKYEAKTTGAVGRTNTTTHVTTTVEDVTDLTVRPESPTAVVDLSDEGNRNGEVQVCTQRLNQ